MVGREVLIGLLALILVAGTAHATTDDERLATLASHMLNLTEVQGKDYVMECGPKAQVIPVQSQQNALQGERYCVMDLSGQMLFGTFITAGEPAAVLRTYNDSAYRAHIGVNDVNPARCGTLSPERFVQCDDAIRYVLRASSGDQTVRLYTYAQYDPATTGSGATYIIVSEQPLASLGTSRSFFGRALDFFRGLTE